MQTSALLRCTYAWAWDAQKLKYGESGAVNKVGHLYLTQNRTRLTRADCKRCAARSVELIHEGELLNERTQTFFKVIKYRSALILIYRITGIVQYYNAIKSCAFFIAGRCEPMRGYARTQDSGLVRGWVVAHLVSPPLPPRWVGGV